MQKVVAVLIIFTYFHIFITILQNYDYLLFSEVGRVLQDLQVTGENVPTKTMRNLIFLHHKISNEDQSTNILSVKNNVKREMAKLGLTGNRSGDYLDMVSIHSPLTDRDRRLNSYAALLELKEEGFVKCVGVCNYGVGALSKLTIASSYI